MPLRVKLIKMSLIDPPAIAMRSQVSDEYLAGLAASIRDTGLINPISVVAENGRFRIYAGHCRFLACKMLGRDEIECRDYTGSDVKPEHIKAHENLHRSDPNDGEILVYLGDMQEKHNYTLEQLCQLTGKSEHWVNTRMALYRGDKAVFDALLEGKINLGHATVLNRFPDDYRATYLQNVINSTPPVKIVEQWLTDVKLIVSHQVPGASIPPPVPVQEMPGLAPVQSCVLCGAAHSPWTYQTYTAHKGCMDSIVQQLQQGGK